MSWNKHILLNHIICKSDQLFYLHVYIHQQRNRNRASILIKKFLSCNNYSKTNIFYFVLKMKFLTFFLLLLNYNTFSRLAVCEHCLLRSLTFFSKWCKLLINLHFDNSFCKGIKYRSIPILLVTGTSCQGTVHSLFHKIDIL